MGMHIDLLGCQVKQLRQSLSPLFCFPDIMNLNSSSKLGNPRTGTYTTHVSGSHQLSMECPREPVLWLQFCRTPYPNILLMQQKFNSTKIQNSWGTPCYFSSCKISIEKYEKLWEIRNPVQFCSLLLNRKHSGKGSANSKVKTRPHDQRAGCMAGMWSASCVRQWLAGETCGYHVIRELIE